VEIVFRVGSTAMVVERNTRNKGNTHHTSVVPLVQPLLKCAPSCRSRSNPFGWMAKRGATTLNAACRWTAPIMTVSHSSSSITSHPLQSCKQQPESQELLPVAALAPVRPNPAEGLAHTAVKQDCRRVTHTSLVTIRPPVSSCQLHRGSHSTTPFKPLSTGWVHTRHARVDDRAAS
jgi:hypothetical protein